MSSILSSQVGTLDLLDLNVVCQFYGRDFLPYPFMFTEPSRFATRDEAAAYANTAQVRTKAPARRRPPSASRVESFMQPLRKRIRNARPKIRVGRPRVPVPGSIARRRLQPRPIVPAERGQIDLLRGLLETGDDAEQPLTARLIGVARWLHGERQPATRVGEQAG